MISENTKRIKHSKIREMFNMALEYDNPINLTIGEPDFTAADNVAAAGCRASQCHSGTARPTGPEQPERVLPRFPG